MIGPSEGLAPREMAAAFELVAAAAQSGGYGDDRERFAGWGVMGLTFDSGHVLGLRRFPMSSIGPGYTSVWHRTPKGEWSVWSTVPGELSCARYIGRISTCAAEAAIELTWAASDRLRVTVPGHRLFWDLRLESTPVTRSVGALARRLPGRVTASERSLRLLGAAAGPLLGSGRLALTGKMPNRQTFHIVPKQLWRVAASRAILQGRDMGEPGPLAEQATLGDFRVPQRGLLAAAALDFDALNRSSNTAREGNRPL